MGAEVGGFGSSLVGLALQLEISKDAGLEFEKQKKVRPKL